MAGEAPTETRPGRCGGLEAKEGKERRWGRRGYADAASYAVLCVCRSMASTSRGRGGTVRVTHICTSMSTTSLRRHMHVDERHSCTPDCRPTTRLPPSVPYSIHPPFTTRLSPPPVFVDRSRPRRSHVCPVTQPLHVSLVELADQR